MEIQEIITFNTIVEQGNFNKAANKLGYSQAAVTVQIKKLESEMETKLFDRIGKKVSLTADGKTFYEHTIRILNEVSDAKSALVHNNNLNGTLRIGTVDSLCNHFIAEPLIALHKKFPDIQIIISTSNTVEILNKLQKNDIDLALLVCEPVTDPDYVVLSKKDINCYFVTYPSHPLFSLKKVHPDDLLQYPLFMIEKSASYRIPLERLAHENHREIIPSIETNNTNLIKSLMKANMGISYLPDYVVKDEIERNELKKIPTTELNFSISQQLIGYKNKWISEEMKQFIEVYKESVSH